MEKRKKGRKIIIFLLLFFMISLAGLLFTIKHKQIQDEEFWIEIQLLGGSGKASIDSPILLSVKNEEMTATIRWSSPYYQYIKLGETLYYPVNQEGNSEFVIPIVALDQEIPIVAQTIAMGTPHEISYTIFLDSSTIKEMKETTFSTVEESESTGKSKQEKEKEWSEVYLPDKVRVKRMELAYAKNFAVDYYEGNYRLILISDGSAFLLLPEGAEVPENLPSNIKLLQQPIQTIYLAATSVMNLLDALDGLDAVKLSGTKAKDWYVENARKRMEEGKILYAGKYSEPDYERILAENCELSIQSNMISHAPEVKEKLEELNIPVLVDWSSYEEHPLGRSEWIKLYGALLDKEEEAEQLFQIQVEKLEQVKKEKATGKSVVYFYISSSGSVVTRASEDYIAKMVELAGGEYLLGDAVSGSSSSMVTLEMEQFYKTAKDADYIIYNSTINGELTSLEQLLAKNSLLKDFKAVKEGNVWCTSQNLYQESLRLGEMIADLHQILTIPDTDIDELAFLYPLK